MILVMLYSAICFILYYSLISKILSQQSQQQAHQYIYLFVEMIQCRIVEGNRKVKFEISEGRDLVFLVGVDNFVKIGDLKTFQNMKTQFLKNFINIKEKNRQAYDSYLQRISKAFENLKADHQPNLAIKLQSELHAAKDHKPLKPKDKQSIYKYLVERNTLNFHFLQANNNVQLRLIKMTKTNLEDYQLNWQQVWQRLLEKYPEIPSVRLYNDLSDFLKVIRHLYITDNALRVVNYFIERHSLNADNLCGFICSFVNINIKTPKQVVITYLQRLLELYHLNQIKASDLLIMYLNAAKNHHSFIPQKIHTQLSKILLYSLATPSSEKKDSIQSKFSTQTANLLFKIIGSCNSYSLTLLQQAFQLIKNFIRPFQDSKKPLRFLCILLMGLSKRVETEENTKQKLEKLKVKEEKRIKNELKQQKQQEEQSALTAVEKQQKKVDQAKIPTKDQKQSQKQQEQESQSQEQQQNDSDEEQQENKVQKLMNMQLQIQESPVQKTSNIQSKILKLQTLLNNHITDDIKKAFKQFIGQNLEQIFYVNSKKIVHRLLKQTFKFFPEFIPRSLGILEKAGNIPQINQEGLISNIKHIAKFLFSKEMITSSMFLQNILKTLNKVQRNRRITDVWQIIATFIQKIPLLDEKDMEKVPESTKDQFQKKFGQRYDSFYQTYSELVFESLKRLFNQSQHYDVSTSSSIEKHILDLIFNSYPFYKKRVIRQIQQQIIQNSNKFLITICQSGFKISHTFEQSLRQMIDNRNIESQQNLNLDINVNLILMTQLDIGVMKTLFRKYSKKNNFKFLRQCMISLTNYNLNHEPLSSLLQFFDKKPLITLTQQQSFQFIREKLIHVYNYIFELIDQLYQQIKQFDEKQLKQLNYNDLVLQVYNSKQSTFKSMKVQKRKTINELLQIIKYIAQSLFHQYQEYNPTTNTIDYKPAPYNRESLLTYPKFIEILDNLVYNEIFLHDHNIMQNITEIIENQVFFMYRHQVRYQKDLLRKYTKKNSKQQLPGQSNLSYTNYIFYSKARIAHFSLLLNRYKDTVSITGIFDQLKILLIAPGNEKSNVAIKIMTKKSKTLQQQAQILVSLINNNLASRFYYEKVLALFGDFFTTGYVFDSSHVIRIINAYLPLIQSQNIKIKDQSLKSFEKFLKTMHKDTMIGPVEQQLREFAKKEKHQLIWIICVLMILKEGKKTTSLEEYLGYLRIYLRQLQPLIQSPIRIVRRLSLFTYSFCIKKLRQSTKRYQTLPCSAQKYSKPKTMTQLFETGFLREQHINNPSIANRQVLKKQAPYTSYTAVTETKDPLYEQIVRESFAFLLDKPEEGQKVLKQFHTDMATSVQEVMAMAQGKKHDLGEIAIKNLQGCYVSTLLRNLHFERYQLYFGQRFFRYLFDRDATGYDLLLFKTTHEDVEKMLVNLEGYDNQSLYFIYMVNLFEAYAKHGQQFSVESKAAVEKFCIKVITEIIYKGSGTVFKKLNILLSKNERKQKLVFIANYLSSLIQKKQKVSRASQLLLSLNEDNYAKYTSTAEFILSQKVQISHNFINSIISSVISLPEKYMITAEQAKHFGILDIQSEMQSNSVQRLLSQETYMLNTEPFNVYLRTTLKGYIQSINQPIQDDQGLRLQKELIKATYNIATSAIVSYCQFYQTKETVHSIVSLLQLVFRLFDCRMELLVDFKQLDDSIRNLLSNKYDDIANFETILDCVMSQIHKLPIKRQADQLKIITNRPGNFLFVSQPFYLRFVGKLIEYEQQSMIYKEVLLCLSTILAYVPIAQPQIQTLSKSLSKGQSMLLFQAYLLSTQDIGCKLIERVLAGSSRERRNVFCKEMLQVRGKREYLDDEEKYLQWKEIKQYSNPYHYHA